MNYSSKEEKQEDVKVVEDILNDMMVEIHKSRPSQSKIKKQALQIYRLLKK